MKVNILKYLLLLPALAIIFAACDDTVTYSDMKEKERNAVNRFVKEKGINIIPYDQFVDNDSTTDVKNNEFVEIDDVYMQIINNPKDATDARKINDGDTRNILVRYTEYNIMEGDTISSNVFMSEPDEMRVQNHDGTYSATFTSGVMSAMYGNAVPNGWLTPFNFLYFTRYSSNLAEVVLIVPHSKGTVNASTYVYPFSFAADFSTRESLRF
ncbi:MAG: DUF4827 domain-containing protein [Bacteroidaceae bacterium]|nr:DUF4827 domain-containing protein [Bacteroidaceae bacterium]